MKNWKSTSAFLVFIGIYVYTILIPSTDDVVNTAGWIAFAMSLVMVFRNDITADILTKLVDKIGTK